MALVALSPMRKAHCTTSGVTPILANIGTKMKAINVHLEVADTMMRYIRAARWRLKNLDAALTM